ncbi:DEBR0S4_00848g1_1 [Brettanomyces bruxellensis]|uniref:DEBR0S4_00848g1_1 n=1 Tax=Dekkera bruxellensis TaxID=5007 RepID=A0A7D9H0L6_DEKBR|nr:DEBR0S4_00848g1_1 [Brettanomyces bruxellensis]
MRTGLFLIIRYQLGSEYKHLGGIMTEKKEDRIEPATIGRLFQAVAFPDPDNTRITKKTLDMVSEYIELFTEEAITRANQCRIEQEQQVARNYEVEAGEEKKVQDGGVIDSRHLEAIAGLLVLDF